MRLNRPRMPSLEQPALLASSAFEIVPSKWSNSASLEADIACDLAIPCDRLNAPIDSFATPDSKLIAVSVCLPISGKYLSNTGSGYAAIPFF